MVLSNVDLVNTCLIKDLELENLVGKCQKFKMDLSDLKMLQYFQLFLEVT
jgi:hypothetical protein